MKLCKGCFKVKRTTEFHKNKANKDGLQYKCKQCKIEIVKIWRLEKIEKRWDVIYAQR